MEAAKQICGGDLGPISLVQEESNELSHCHSYLDHILLYLSTRKNTGMSFFLIYHYSDAGDNTREILVGCYERIINKKGYLHIGVSLLHLGYIQSHQRNPLSSRTPSICCYFMGKGKKWKVK